jgi:hypothetical protein
MAKRTNSVLKANAKAGIVEVKAKLLSGGWLCTVTIADLKFLNYQREELTSHVDKITGRFDRRKANPLLLSYRNGKLNCMNGRQTSAVLRNVKEPVWDAVVFNDMTYADEADMFFDFNDTPRKMGGWHKFFAKMRSKLGQSNRHILAIIHANRLTTPLDMDVNKQGNADVTSARIVSEAYNLGGEVLLDRLCQVLAKCWKSGGVVSEDAKQLDLLRGLVKFLHNDNVPFHTTVCVLKTMTATHVREIANRMSSKGRIDAAQIRQALQSIMGVVKENKAA